MRKPPIEILLATYNGERYLREQIDSLLGQTYSNLTILARDDGSKDKTPEILHEYENRFPEIFRVIETDEPSGAPHLNFLRLMRASTSHFVMFSDQDDVWDSDKIAVTMAEMDRMADRYGDGTPLLVFSDVMVVDERLNIVSGSFWSKNHFRPGAVHHLPSLLRQNVVTGCTMLINRALLNLALAMPPEAIMHDWWIALAANTFGHSAYIERATMKYRQHASNALGAGTDLGRHTLVPPFTDRAGWAAEWARVYTHSAAFLRTYGDSLPSRKRVVFEDAIRCAESKSRFERVFRMLRHRYFRYGRRSNLAMLWYLWDEECARDSARIAKSGLQS